MRKFYNFSTVAYFVWAAFILYLAWRVITFGGARSVYPLFLQGGFHWRAGLTLYHGACQEFQYYPGFAALMSLFTFLPAPQIFGAGLWSALNVGAYLWAAKAFARQFITTPKWRSIFFLALLPLALDGLLCLQSNPLIAAALMYGTGLIARQKWTRGMIFLVGGGIIKIAPLAVALLMIALFFRQLSWRFALILAAYLLLPFLFNEPQYVINTYHEWLSILLHEADGRRWNYRDFWTLWEYIASGTVTQNAIIERGKEYLTYYRGLQLAVAGVLALWGAYRHYWARLKFTAADAGIFAFAGGVWWLMLWGPSTELATLAIPAPAIAWGLVNAYESKRDGWLMLVAFIVVLLGSNGDLDFYCRHVFPHTDLPKLLLPLGGILCGVWGWRRFAHLPISA